MTDKKNVPESPPPEVPYIKGPEMVCPQNCGHPHLLSDDKFCRGCGSELIPRLTRVCHTCKGKILRDDIYCGGCGARYKGPLFVEGEKCR